MFQALNAGRIISKELLFKDVRPADRRREGERFPLRFVEWERNGDPYFYENNHLTPRPVDGSGGSAGGAESWIFYNTAKFSGKKLVVPPGATHTATERGVYSLLVWSGTGRYAGHDVRGGDPDRDELLVAHDTATGPHAVENTGVEDLVVFTFFGPDVNPDAPRVTPWAA
jgi:hypothetical protein